MRESQISDRGHAQRGMTSVVRVLLLVLRIVSYLFLCNNPKLGEFGAKFLLTCCGELKEP